MNSNEKSRKPLFRLIWPHELYARKAEDNEVHLLSLTYAMVDIIIFCDFRPTLWIPPVQSPMIVYSRGQKEPDGTRRS